VEISGVDQLPYNGIFQITSATDPLHLHHASSPGVNATGTTKLAGKSIRKISSLMMPSATHQHERSRFGLHYTYDAIGRLSSTDNNTRICRG